MNRFLSANNALDGTVCAEVVSEPYPEADRRTWGTCGGRGGRGQGGETPPPYRARPTRGGGRNLKRKSCGERVRPPDEALHSTGPLSRFQDRRA